MTSVTPEGLGIDLQEAQGRGLYKWLLASFLVGKRIRSTVALEAYRNLVDRHGLNCPRRLARCAHRDLVRLLGQAGYARYDESTARRLKTLGERLESELHQYHTPGQPMDVDKLKVWLLSFDGIGPKTSEIFLREAGPLLQQGSPQSPMC